MAFVYYVRDIGQSSMRYSKRRGRCAPDSVNVKLSFQQLVCCDRGRRAAVRSGWAGGRAQREEEVAGRVDFEEDKHAGFWRRANKLLPNQCCDLVIWGWQYRVRVSAWT